MLSIDAIVESLYGNLAGLIDDREALLDNEQWETLGSSNSPRQRQWDAEKYQEARNLSRALCEENPYACNAVENRISYLIGSGFTYRVDPLEKKHEAAAKAIDTFLREWQHENRWKIRQQENCRRIDRDGEVYLRIFSDRMPLVRYIEPEHIQPNESQREQAPFGHMFANEDHEEPIAFLEQGKYLSASEVQHRKANVDMNTPRGVPIFWPVRRNLRRASLLLRNMSALTEVQSAIAMIRKHRGVSKSGIEQFASNHASTTFQTDTLGTSKSDGTTRLKSYGPGTILDVDGNREYEFPSNQIDASGMVGVLRAELRAIAARLVMPEFMFTSDASNAAYASTMVAEGPAVRNFNRLQHAMGDDDVELMWKVIDSAIDAGNELPDHARSKIRITADGPDVQVRDFFKQNKVYELAHKQKIMSAQSWAGRLGLDYQHEQTQIQEHQKNDPTNTTDDSHDDSHSETDELRLDNSRSIANGSHPNP